jgi:glycerol-3-phosphate cytidylyltransferase
VEDNVLIKGYTTGVFDMFHVGHLNILQNAKKHCDYLIVGVSTDSLVEVYKNKLPVIPQKDRFAIIESLKCVDLVVYQNTRDKLCAYSEHKFDVMFVGDDWKGNKMFKEVEKKLGDYGSKVVYFPYTNHVSSTKLKKVLEQIENNSTGL